MFILRKILLITLAIACNGSIIAMQTPAEKKTSQDRLYIKRGLNDVLNNSSNFFAGTTINELNRMIDLGQNFLKSKDSINFFKAELNKNDDQVTSALNSLIQIANDRLMQKGEPSRLGKVVQATAQKPQAKQVPKLAVKNTQQVANSQKKSQNNSVPNKPVAPKVSTPEPQKGVQAPQQAQVVSANAGNSNNDPAPEDNAQNVSIWAAAAAGNVKLVEWHIAHGTDVNKLSPGNETALIVAVAEEREQVVDLLLKASADVNKANLNNYTPLIFAIFRRNYSIAKKIVEANANVNTRIMHNWTPLMEASMKGSHDIVKLLIEAGADISATDDMGMTARDHALMRGQHHIKIIIDDTLAQRASADVSSYVPLRVYKDHEIMQEKLKSISKEELAERDPLWKAALDGNIELIKWHLAIGSDINKGNPGNDTPLMLAVTGGHEEIVDLLLKYGADIYKKNLADATALEHSLNLKSTSILKKLIDAGSDIEVRNQWGQTPLSKAIMLRRLDEVLLLLDAGANVNVKDDQGHTPRDWALMVGDKDIGQVINERLGLANNGERGLPILSINGKNFLQFDSTKGNNSSISTSPKPKNSNLLLQAAAGGHLNVVKALIANGVDINDGGYNKQTPLSYAAMYDQHNVMDLLIRLGADVNLADNNGETPLMFATYNNQIEAVEKLINAHANPNIQNIQGSTALIEASKKGLYAIAKILIAAGADILTRDYWNQTARQYAEANKHKKIVELLDFSILNIQKEGANKPQKIVSKTSIWQEAAKGEIVVVTKDLKEGAQINAANSDGKTILMEAAQHGHNRLVLSLIAQNADLNVIDANGNTALQLAIKKGHKDVINTLMQNKVDIKNKNKDGQSPLWLAVQMGNPEAIDSLINAGADLKEADEDGYNLVMLATYLYRYNNTIITQLYKAGLNVNDQDDFGVTPLMIAASRGNDEAAQELLDAGASLKLEDVTGRSALDYASNDEIRKFLEAEIAKRYVHVPVVKPINLKLLTAAKKNDLATVKKLINEKVDLEVRNDHDATPLLLAARWATLPMVKLLVEAGANIETQDDQHKTPLHSAVANGKLDVATYLLEHNANVNHIESFRNRTPLHWVVRMTQGSIGKEKDIPQMSLETGIKIMNLLLKYGVDTKVLDNTKKTALQWAKISKQKEYIKILEKVTSPKNKISFLGSLNESINLVFNDNKDIALIV